MATRWARVWGPQFFVREELFFRKGCFAVKFTTRSDTPVALKRPSVAESEDLECWRGGRTRLLSHYMNSMKPVGRFEGIEQWIISG